MSFGDKFQKFKTAGLQAVGKAEKTSEGDEFAAMINLMKETKTEVTAFYDAAKKYYKNQQEAGEAMEKLSGAMQRLQFSDSKAKSVMIEAVPMVSKSATGTTEYLNSFKTSIMDVLNNVLEIQYKQAEKSWKAVEDTRLEFDSSSARFKSILENKKSTQEDIDRAKQRADDSEAAYNRAKEDCVTNCQELANAKNAIVTKLSDFANQLGTFGAVYCENAQAFLTTQQ